MTYKIDNLTVEELAVAKRAVEDVRRKKRDEEERLAILDSVKGVWPDGKPTIYIAGNNSDTTEGRGTFVARGIFIDRHLAEQARNLLPGVYGTPNTSPVRQERVFLTLAEWRKLTGV